MPNRDENELNGLSAKVINVFDADEPPEDSKEDSQVEQSSNPIRVRPAPNPSTNHPDIGKIVWMSCRASRPCGNNQSKISMVFKHGDFGGQTIRYKCQGCRQSFTIRL